MNRRRWVPTKCKRHAIRQRVKHDTIPPMVAPSKPLWLVNSWTRELKLRFDRAARGGERVVTFESDLLIQLDEKRLRKGVTCASSDSAKRQYNFRFAARAAPIVSFYISARKAENSTSVLSVAIEGGPQRHSFDLRINTHNPTGWLDWAFLARNALRELPRPWRYITLAVASQLTRCHEDARAHQT